MRMRMASVRGLWHYTETEGRKLAFEPKYQCKAIGRKPVNEQKIAAEQRFCECAWRVSGACGITLKQRGESP